MRWRPAPGRLARDTSLAYHRLNGALRLLHRGANLVVSNPDLTHPGADRGPVLETGALLAALRACLPALEPVIVGKPSTTMFEVALARFGVAASDAVMVGDNPDTDGIGAARAGITLLLVGPGNPLASIADLLP